MSKVTAEELSQAIAVPMESCFRKDGITRSFLVSKLKKELHATEVKAFNDKGVIVYSKPLVDWDIRQRARMDAQKLMGLYPAEKYEHSGPDGGPIPLKVEVEFVKPGDGTD